MGNAAQTFGDWFQNADHSTFPIGNPMGDGWGFPTEDNYPEEVQEAFGAAENRQSPLILDLDGDGLDLIALADSRAMFDLDNDGFVESVGWVGADDGLLVMDLDSNGFIEGSTELFGGTPSDGFASLRLLDSNADNVIDANDGEFQNLKVWRDLDGDGISDAGELQSLTEAGISSINLDSVHLTTPQTIAGNTVTDSSTFTWISGGTGTIADVWFSVNQAFSFDVRPVEVAPAALFLPTLRGYGVISSLTTQMSRDATLLELVQDFVETTLTAVSDAQVLDIMYRWAGVDGIAANSRTAYGASIDSRKIVFLEHFLDDPYTQGRYGSYASPTGVPDLEIAFAIVFEQVKARLLAQSHLREIVGPVAFDYLGDRFFPDLDFEQIVSQAQAQAADAASDGAGQDGTVAWWRAAISTLIEVGKDVDAGGYSSLVEAAVRATTGDEYGIDDLFDKAIFGTSGADSLSGAAGHDTLNGGLGNDTYIFASYHGHDRIIDTGGAADAVVLGSGILPGAVTLSRAGSSLEDLIITTGIGHDIRIVGQFKQDGSGGHPSRIEEIRFDGGTVWDYATIIATLLRAHPERN